jgi:hypothetical protein
MNKNAPVTKTLHSFGSAFKIQLRGNPDAVMQEVSRLFNFGIVTGSDGKKKKRGVYVDHSPLPESFRPGIDDSVTVNSYPKAFEKGVGALATVRARAIMVKHGLKRPSSFRKLRAQEIEAIRAEFIEGENIYTGGAGEVSTTSVPIGEQV